MYLWIGIDVDEQVQLVKESVHKIEQIIHFEHSNFTLPFHVSLKITFHVEDNLVPQVTQDIIDLLQSTQPFVIPVLGYELEDTIAWLRMAPCPYLEEIHDKLNQMLLERYGVPLHPYDTDYKFHTTLFMSEDPQKVVSALALVQDTLPPTEIAVNKFLLGSSQNGALGTFAVTHEVPMRG